jgi:hypothetical protein
MPAAFEACRAAGGRIRTISGPSKKFGLKAGEYVHVCFNKGQMARGDLKTKEKK